MSPGSKAKKYGRYNAGLMMLPADFKQYREHCLIISRVASQNLRLACSQGLDVVTKYA